ncbi:30S ribosomal subunit protein S16 [Candidatus Blochmanniella pennsylvanica str. BPEN]|uniref:Small ribosomal subunit protein bS16 n=1 Tax=Blochmanniella pennsylvanica (strain BPEN) TaxID=291272 RepID=RS16_BLOPB|nr:30S ribosomal protein S16 [Candidatus Blochmannia pennsylvanicus]Q493M3.1 RecName: Full=Small ribosomal subunit protein bS16; AltName: Full=30S ribosomal protein S16 [Candidatus Blochmannia pennsylvanicus str. BPEN]AAZ40817.1 30S ribosomal subunit protein S16 [Candidatus Blochmannia pennsylvanicus str. BPEN]UOY04655.1 30S ribosomal protein S16 [Candidatus Blochmannia pennsylvanicus]
MVRIRLARGGHKKTPFYHIVITDSRSARDGRFIERVGFFSPIKFSNRTGLGLRVNLERVKYWLYKGASPSDRVLKLIKNL